MQSKRPVLQDGKEDTDLCGRYDVALLYLEQASYNLEQAITAYKADEEWEKEHSLEAAKKGKSKASQSSGRRKWGFGGLTGQAS